MISMSRCLLTVVAVTPDVVVLLVGLPSISFSMKASSYLPFT